MKDILFLLTPGFHDGDEGPFYCPHCAIFEGLLALYPALKDQLDIRHVAFPRPRPEIVALLGPDHQSCPVLIIGSTTPRTGEDQSSIQTYGNLRFIDDNEGIGNYLSATYGIPRPH